MDNAIYLGLSRQLTLQRALDITANNIANMDTAGFKVQHLSVRSEPVTPSGVGGANGAPIKYALDQGVLRNFGQGELQTTGATFDLALQGDAFFTVQTSNGNRYTRDGRFTLDAQNRIVDRQGDPVLDASGSPISIDPTHASPVIGKDGTVSQAGQNGQVSQVGKIGMVKFANRSPLTSQGGDLFDDPSGQTPQAATSASMVQGAVERSNVQSISEITNLIQITRAYERVQDMIGSTHDLSSKAIDGLGKLNS